MSAVPATPRTVSAETAVGPGAHPAGPVLDLLLTAPRARTGWRVVPARVGAMCIVELQKLRHDRTELYTRAIQPALWLLIYGETFTRLHAIPTGGIPYLDFLAPGIIAQSAMFIAIFYGIMIIWERDAGVLTKLLGVGLTWNPLKLIAVAVVVILGGAFFSCLSMTIAGIVLTRDRLMGIGQAITMPLFFSSSALYPVSVMPGWLQAISKCNPLSYQVDALRGLLLGTPAHLLTDFTVLVVAALLGILAASSLLGRLAK